MGDRTYRGIIIGTSDLTQNRGRYLIHIEELHSHLDKTKDGFWCYNRISNYSGSSKGAYGSYTPLLIGTRVEVVVNDEDNETGRITAIINDQVPNSGVLPFGLTPQEQNQLYVIAKSATYGNIIAISEDTSGNIPANSIFIYYNTDTGSNFGRGFPSLASSTIRSKIIINKDGLHISTADNLNITVDNNSNVAVNGDCNLKVRGTVNLKIVGNMNISVDGNTSLNSTGDLNIKSGGNVNIESGTSTNIKSSGNVNVDGSFVKIMGGAATGASPTSAADNAGFETFSNKDIAISRQNDISSYNKKTNNLAN